MPYEIKKEKGKYCVFKKDTGENLGCSKTKNEAVKHMQAIAVHEHMETLTSVMLEDNGPVIVGIAATNIPHLPLPPMSVVDVDGKPMVRVPFLRAGIFRHPNGKLVFNDQVFDKMLENHESGKSHYGVSLNEKHRPGVALAWFDKKHGGYIQKETDPEYGNLLVGYGKPTSDRTLEMVKNQEYVFASVELNPKHQSNMIAKLSSDEFEELREEMLLEEETMEDVTISLEEFNTLKEKAAEAEKVAGLVSELDSANATITSLQEKINILEKPVTNEIEIPEEYKIQLEAQRNEIANLKRNALETQVALIVTKAQSYRDSNGYGHSPVLLEIAKSAMLGENIDINNNVIKLESGNSADVADYFRKVFVHLLENIPGQVRFESQSETEDNKSFHLEQGKAYTQEDYKFFW